MAVSIAGGSGIRPCGLMLLSPVTIMGRRQRRQPEARKQRESRKQRSLLEHCHMFSFHYVKHGKTMPVAISEQSHTGGQGSWCKGATPQGQRLPIVLLVHEMLGATFDKHVVID